jgi:hypothetical protein
MYPTITNSKWHKVSGMWLCVVGSIVPLGLLDPCRWRHYNQPKMSGTTQPATKHHIPRRHQCEKLVSCNKILIISVVSTQDRTHLYSTMGNPKHNMTLSITWHKQIKYPSHKRDTEMVYSASNGVHQLTGYHLQYSSLLKISYILHGTNIPCPYKDTKRTLRNASEHWRKALQSGESYFPCEIWILPHLTSWHVS